MSNDSNNKPSYGFWDKLLVALIVLVFTVIGNIVAYRLNANYGHSQTSRQQVVEKTGEVWKGIVDYRTHLDKISQVKFGGFITSSTETTTYSKELIAARSQAIQARKRLDKLIGDNSFYIGHVLTGEAALYVSYLEIYYQQRDKVYYSKSKPSNFEVHMLESTQKLLDQAGRYLTAKGSYAVSSG